MIWLRLAIWLRAVIAVVSLLGAAGAHAAGRFKHIIIVFQENRTPDNLFGSAPHFEPGVDVTAFGVNSHGAPVPLTPTPMAGCFDPGHGHQGFEDQFNAGADQNGDALSPGCVPPANPNFTFVDNSTGGVQPYFDLARNYGFANRMFQTNQGPSLPAHQFIFGGTSSPSTESPLFVSSNGLNQTETVGCTAPPDQTVTLIDGTGNTTTNTPIYPCFERPTMADMLDAAHISWRYYTPSPGGIWSAPNAIRHLCAPAYAGSTLTCQGPDWTNGSVVSPNTGQVLTDIAQCKLAAVNWVIPKAAQSDHASVTDGTGPQWVADIVNAVGQQPACATTGETYWNDTAIVITWDDWGGWYDHVKPPINKIEPASPPAWGDGFTYGFRVPLLMVSAYTPSGYVDNTAHDFGSILYFVECNFGLGRIGPGDTIYSNFADYQESLRRDSLAEFFSLPRARPFVPIATSLPARYFIDLPPSSVPPDDD